MVKFVSIIEHHHDNFFNEALGIGGKENEASKTAWAFLKSKVRRADLS
jgi:hypothetical protein